ncbi:MAG: hypothetical protein K0R10_191 [Alphaproteobacteria bacterium]|jgi:hypothetical protein|nr:hypothetical protein [Alphaproteobacteria bacterium]
MGYIVPAEYRFDYKSEVALALQMYPQISDQFFFVEAVEQNSHVNPVFQGYGPLWDKHKEDAAAREAVKDTVIGVLGGSYSCATRHKSGLSYIVMYFRRMWQGASTTSAFTLDHELGHQLVPSGFGDSAEKLDGESAADAFACLRTLQRFGPVVGRKMLIRESNQRLTAPLYTSRKNDWVHLTGQMLVQLIKDTEKKAFHELSPEDTIAEAEYYATRYAPTRAQAESQWARLNDLVDDQEIGNYGADTGKK